MFYLYCRGLELLFLLEGCPIQVYIIQGVFYSGDLSVHYLYHVVIASIYFEGINFRFFC